MGRYQGYENYKDSGVEWLGDIPEHWEQKRLRFAVNLINNKFDAESSDLSYMGLEHIESWTGRRIEDEKAFSEGVGAHFLPNDVLFGKLRPYLAKVYLSETEGLASTEALVLRCNNSIFPEFLKYYILSRDFINIVDSSTFGSKMPRASWDFIGNLFLTFPPLDEQESIAHFLDRKTTQIDALIAKKEALIEKLDEKRTALISHTVTKGLDPSVPMKDSGVEWLGDIPEHWELVGLTKYLKSLVDYRGKTPEKMDDGIFLVTAKNIKGGIIDYSLSQEFVKEEEYEDIMRRGKPEIGDVLLTTEAPLGEIANVDKVDIALAQRIVKMQGKISVLDNYFLKYWMIGKYFNQHLQSLCTGSTALGIKASKFCLLKVVLPSVDEQKKIVDSLDRKTAEIDRQKAKVKEEIELLKEYRTALITNAVTGKIDVRQVAI
jgi:type I restriction enzyme, S subunit